MMLAALCLLIATCCVLILHAIATALRWVVITALSLTIRVAPYCTGTYQYRPRTSSLVNLGYYSDI
jgi:hypothetical protein